MRAGAGGQERQTLGTQRTLGEGGAGRRWPSSAWTGQEPVEAGEERSVRCSLAGRAQLWGGIGLCLVFASVCPSVCTSRPTIAPIEAGHCPPPAVQASPAGMGRSHPGRASGGQRPACVRGGSPARPGVPRGRPPAEGRGFPRSAPGPCFRRL